MRSTCWITLAVVGAGLCGCSENSAGPSSRPDAAQDTVVIDSVATVDATTRSDTTIPAETTAAIDPCPAPAGITWQGERRFMTGINYAWRHFGGDFGGIATWSQAGVAAEPAPHATNLAAMKAAGVNVVRWWVWPDLRGDGVVLSAAGDPVGLGGTVVADVQAALSLAADADVYVMLCLLSFDGFRPTRDVAGILTPGLRAIAVDRGRRDKLVEHVVRPLARAVAASPHADRMIAWDLMNEPEWAVQGASLYGDDPDFGPIDELEPVTHAEMERFLGAVLGGIRQESGALITVGGAAVKWAHAWSQLDLDFHQFHIYDWVDRWWPYDQTPAALGVADKPVVMGEFPMAGLSSADTGTLLESWFGDGYAGALGWQFSEATADELGAIDAFVGRHPCETTFGSPAE